MRKGNLTREQAMEIVGDAAVLKVDDKSCDFTNRVGYNGSVQGDDEVEFSAATPCEAQDGTEVVLVAYYYQTATDVDGADGDLGSLDWKIEGYEII